MLTCNLLTEPELTQSHNKTNTDLYCLVPGGGGGGTLIFSYIRRLGKFLGFKILDFNFLGGFQKKTIFLGV